MPDGAGFDLGGGTLSFQAMAPALVPVNRTQAKPFIRTFDVYELHAGVDHLNVLGGATPGAGRRHARRHPGRCAGARHRSPTVSTCGTTTAPAATG